MRHFLLLAISMLLITSCATKTIYQMDGQPVSDNIVRAKTFNLDLTLKYSLVNFFNVKEGNESYESYEFLKLTSPEIHKLDDPTKLVMNIVVFNPSKEDYKIIKYVRLEGGDVAESVVYEGSLSRNVFNIELPLVPNRLLSFYWDACNKNGDLIFKSFKAQYVIEG
jgi:hypothetical protein